MLLKLLSFFIIAYFIFKVLGHVFRFFLGSLGMKSAYQQQNSQRGRQEKKTTADGISIEFEPEDKNKRSAKNFKGGEYVDYEEIK